MTRQTRMIVTLVAVSVAGIMTLTLVADQYRKRMPQPGAHAAGSEDAAARATRLVEGFLAAREAAQGVAKRQPIKMAEVVATVTGDFRGVEGRRMNSGIDIIASYKIARYDAFTARGMTFDDYAAVRAAWRTWSAGQPVPDEALARAFEAKRGELQKAGEGLNEAFDDAVK